MARVDIAFACSLNNQMGCQDRLRVNSDADEALASYKIVEKVSEVFAQNHFIITFFYILLM